MTVVEQAASGVASYWTYLLSMFGLLFGTLTVQEWVAVTSILLALATFFVNLHYKRRLVRIEERRFELEFQEDLSEQ